MLSKIIILTIHLMVALILGYLSFAIIFGKSTPKLVGIFLILTTILVVSINIYSFKESKDCYNVDDSHERRLRDARDSRREHPNDRQLLAFRGLSYDKNDHNYEPIGGAGGLGFL